MTTEGRTIGEMLREARERKQLTIQQVNRETKISPEVLMSLEQNDFSSFVSETYLKGFLKTYATFLELDADRMWNKLARKRDESPGASGTFWDIEETVREEKLKSPQLFRRIVLPILIVVIVLLAILLIRARKQVEELQTGQLTPYVETGVIEIGSDV